MKMANNKSNTLALNVTSENEKQISKQAYSTIIQPSSAPSRRIIPKPPPLAVVVYFPVGNGQWPQVVIIKQCLCDADSEIIGAGKAMIVIGTDAAIPERPDGIDDSA